jgi:hypothetical protein
MNDIHEHGHELHVLANDQSELLPRSPVADPLPPSVRPGDSSSHSSNPGMDGQDGNDTTSDSNLVCTPFGACEPCPPEAVSLFV